jgi:hypothetical protein
MNKQTLEQRIDLTTADGATELEAHVQCRLGREVHNFLLVVTDDGLILRGHAHTYYAKQLAEQLVMEATALPILANEIEVC